MLLSLAPIALLVLLLSASVALFGSDASYGPNQVALIIASAATMLVGWRRGMGWQAIQDGMVGAITVSIMPMMILLSVGALIGSWIISGTVPGMIYYGVQLLDPGFFYAASAAICALASLSLGSSWTVASTLGIGLMGIATTYSLSPAITAGAVISGAYFGDKLSPLSDTTNLAAAAVVVGRPRCLLACSTPSAARSTPSAASSATTRSASLKVSARAAPSGSCFAKARQASVAIGCFLWSRPVMRAPQSSTTIDKSPFSRKAPRSVGMPGRPRKTSRKYISSTR